MLRKTLSTLAVSAIALTAVSSMASAGELEGSYLGLGTGYSWTDSDVSGTNVDTDGMTVGVYGGHIWNMGHNWFTGVEGEVFNGDVDGSRNGFNVEQEWSLGASGLVGYQFNKDWMAYGKLGVVTTQFETNDAGTSDDVWIYGARAGLGAEYTITPNWALRGEYNYTNYADENVAASGGGSVNLEPESHAVVFGLSYRF